MASSARAWCWRDGSIEIATTRVRRKKPQGAVLIAVGPEDVLARVIGELSVSGPRLLWQAVPGVRQAKTEAAAIEAIALFYHRVRCELERRGR